MVTDVAVEPTCTETGLTEGSHCSECGAVAVAQQIIPANGHGDPVDDAAVNNSCTSYGLTAGSHCSICGDAIIAQQVIPAHFWVAATETEPKHCSECGIEEHSEYIKVQNTASAGVLYSSVCLDYELNGSKYLNYLLGNKDGAVTALVDKGTHSMCWDAFGNNPRIYANNTITFSATEGNLISRVVIHVQGTLMDELPPTNMVANRGLYHLDNYIKSGDAVDEEVATIIWNAEVGDSAPNLVIVLNQPVESFTFQAPDSQFCYFGFTISYVECSDECSYGEGIVTAPTCAADGYTTYTCTKCGHSYNDSIVAATGEHSYVDTTCSVCGASKEE